MRGNCNLVLISFFKLQLKDALGASLSFTGSAMAGNVNTLAVGLYEEFTIEH